MSVVSKKIEFQVVSTVRYVINLIYKLKKSKCPSTDPRGTPDKIFSFLEICLAPICVVCWRPIKYEENQLFIIPRTP